MIQSTQGKPAGKPKASTFRTTTAERIDLASTLLQRRQTANTEIPDPPPAGNAMGIQDRRKNFDLARIRTANFLPTTPLSIRFFEKKAFRRQRPPPVPLSFHVHTGAPVGAVDHMHRFENAEVWSVVELVLRNYVLDTHNRLHHRPSAREVPDEDNGGKRVWGGGMRCKNQLST